jgi:hypothetical protein
MQTNGKEAVVTWIHLRKLKETSMGIIGVPAEILNGNLSSSSQKRHFYKLSVGDLTQKFDTINKRTSC